MASSLSSSATKAFPVFITTDSLHSILSHQTLINHFHSSLPAVSSSLSSPIRQSHAVSPTSSLLPFPPLHRSQARHSAVKLPGIHGSYVLFSSTSGQTLATMDGTALTLYRTACVSGLASRLLSRTDSEILIRAHLAARPGLKRVIIWNRTEEKARALAAAMKGSGGGVEFESSGRLDEAVVVGDIVSCATNSEVALVKGERLKVGAHLDLVGSFQHSMRECDDEAIRRGRVFVDNEAALVEAGELVGAFKRGVIGKGDVCGMLVELIGGEKAGRRSAEEITVFKSVGSAVVDILAAQLVYELTRSTEI